MEIPPQLENNLKDGKVVLFLGAGSSLSAFDDNGNPPPNGFLLGQMISDKFLGGKFKDRGLSQICDYAINESNIITFQSFIIEIFETLIPTQSHHDLSTIRWHSIVTTNFDTLIEKAYADSREKFQVPIPFIDNNDKVESLIKDEANQIRLLKLHGCITRNNPQCPLILSTDQYINYLKCRNNIFRMFTQYASERTLLFIGYSMSDPNFRTILNKIEEEQSTNSRARFYAILPSFDMVEYNFWEHKKITLIEGTFEQFIEVLNKKISPSLRKAFLTTHKKKSHSILKKYIKSDNSLSPSCEQFLDNDVEYVYDIDTLKRINPIDFYKGYNEGWPAIEQNLDVERELIDSIILNRIMIPETLHEEKPELILLIGPAGAGKTISMRRMCWKISKELDYLSLFLKQGGSIRTNSIQEIINNTQERVFLFVDNLSQRIKEIKHLINNIGPEGKLLTIVGCERMNEWNISGFEISPFVTHKYELEYLSSLEIDLLISKLEEHKSLGTLQDKTINECREAFSHRAGRQLLVALHEATLGKKFEEIIEDEYHKIVPNEARQIYLTICVLNRLDVPVRAGIISRLHGISFEDFEKRFFHPLERVVFTDYNKYIQDNEYKARHPNIAEIVFERILKDQNEKFNEFMRCLGELNLSYISDEKAFNRMIRASELKNLFSNVDHVKYIYQRGKEIGGETPYLLQQMAIYEMNRAGGNLKESNEMLNKALELSPDNDSIKHTLSELYLRMSESTDKELEIIKYRNEASNISSTLIKNSNVDAYAYHTLAKIGLKTLQEYKTQNFNISNIEFENIIKDIQKNLTEGLQKYPSNSYLLDAESKFAEYLNDSTKVLSSLEKAFENNKRNTFIAIRLSRIYQNKGDVKKAKETLQAALNANRSEKKIHYYFSKLLIDANHENNDEIVYHLERSFSPGDKNYDAQILLGRQFFIMGKSHIEYMKYFKDLANARISFEDREKILYSLDNKFLGRVSKIEANYIIIIRDGQNDTIYFKKINSKESIWNTLAINSRVYFKIGFTFKGPRGFDLEL